MYSPARDPGVLLTIASRCSLRVRPRVRAMRAATLSMNQMPKRPFAAILPLVLSGKVSTGPEPDRFAQVARCHVMEFASLQVTLDCIRYTVFT